MIDSRLKKNEAGETDFGMPSMVVAVHTSFSRIYTTRIPVLRLA
jgi:hypothetical protein